MTFFCPAGDALPGGASLFKLFKISKILPPISDVAPAALSACVSICAAAAAACNAEASPPRFGVGLTAGVEPMGGPPPPGPGGRGADGVGMWGIVSCCQTAARTKDARPPSANRVRIDLPTTVFTTTPETKRFHCSLHLRASDQPMVNGSHRRNAEASRLALTNST